MTTDFHPAQSDVRPANAGADRETGGSAGHRVGANPLAGSGRGALLAAALVAVTGMALTTYGAFAHGGPLLAPGSTLTLLGGAWLGNLLARRDVRLFPPRSPATSPGAQTD